MATTKQLYQQGTQLLFADSATFPNSGSGPPATAANSLIIAGATNVQMNLSVIAPGSAWQSAKTGSLIDTALAFPGRWPLAACIESVSAPAAGGTFDFYWAGSHSSTPATGNPGGASGVDGVFAFTQSTLARLQRIGSLTVDAVVINIDTNVASLDLKHEFGSLIIVNNTNVGMATPADNTHVTLTPRIPVQETP